MSAPFWFSLPYFFYSDFEGHEAFFIEIIPVPYWFSLPSFLFSKSFLIARVMPLWPYGTAGQPGGVM